MAYFAQQLKAFGSKEFSGIVDEISPTARTGDIVFSISSKREINEFNVKIIQQYLYQSIRFH